MTLKTSRRAFLQRASVLSLAGTATPFVMNLASIGEAAAQTATDYKALVCIFLYGGNDYANTLIAADSQNYMTYYNQRPTLAYPMTSLGLTTLTPRVALGGGQQFALAPEMAPIKPIFDAGKMAVVLNVGTLIEPTTKTQYLNNSVRLPPKLFSHNDQQSFWQSSHAEGSTTGWGGLIGDLFAASNGQSSLTCINASGNAVFLTGQDVVQYAVSTGGPIGLNSRNSLQGSTAAATLLKTLISRPVNHVLEAELANVSSRALSIFDGLTTALAAAPVTTTAFPKATDVQSTLGAQLQEVAKLISVNSKLGMKRQVFFVSTSRFDTHDGLDTLHPVLLQNLSDAMRAFYDTIVELRLDSSVVAFTASDFGRALTANNDGSDHGWGNHHFVFGGPVIGGRFYGTPPVLANNGPDDVGQGRLLPTISVDQYAGTLASWFGVNGNNLKMVLPNIGNYAVSNLGFL
jgi:uncharacterized protein (DUF1501 family)